MASVSDPIPFPWTIAVSKPDNCYKPIVEHSEQWGGILQCVWRKRRVAIRAAIDYHLYARDGAVYRAVPWPMIGAC